MTLIGILLLTIINIPIESDGLYHYGIEWVNDYSWPMENLQYSDDESVRIDNKFYNDGWTKSFYKTNRNCKDSHWEGGSLDQDYVDNAHFSVYIGHGDSDDLLISTYTEHADASNCGWGNENWKKNNWVVLYGCHNAQGPFSEAFAGNHLIIGFKSSGRVTSNGRLSDRFVDEMIDDDNYIDDSWFAAGDAELTSSVTQRIMGETPDMFFDHLYGHGNVKADPPIDSTYYYRDNQC